MRGGRTQQHDSEFECEARLLIGALPRRAWAHAQLLLVFSIKSIVVVRISRWRCGAARLPGAADGSGGVHTYP